MKKTMKKLVFAALAALACAVVPSSAAAATGDPCTLGIYIDPSLEAGTLSVSPSGPYTVGQTVTLSAVAKHGYTFAWWEKTFAGEQSVNYQSSFSFVLEGDCEWEAVFRKNGDYFVFVQKPLGDITADPLLSSYAPGTNITLIATPRSGRSIVYETAPDVGPDGTKTWTRLSGNTFTMPAHDIWVQALYSINITASGDEHGTVALSHAGPYYEGDTVTLTMTPDSGYRAKTLSDVPPGTVVSGNTATFTLGDLDDLDIHVDFEKIPTITFNTSVSPSGSGKVDVTYDVVTGNYVATATPTNGYNFLCWINLDDNSILTTANPYALHVTGDTSICAVFFVNVTVAPNIEHGTLEIVNPSLAYAAGQTITLLGHPDEGYVVDYYMFVEIHDGSVTAVRRLDGDSFVMPPWNVVASVAFVQGYTVSAAASTEGTGTVVGAGMYKPGSTVTLVAEPAEGYTFTGWEEDGTVVSTDRIYSFTVQTNRNLTANFQSYNGMSFTINADAVPAAGGTITGTGTYAGGEAVTLTALPAPGYSFLGWSEYGQTIGTNAVYSFTANGNRTLTATFQSEAGVTYLNAAGSELLCENFTTVSSATTAMSTGWYAVAGNVTIPSRIEIGGAVNLILCDGASLTVPNGIHLTGSNALTIWGQNAGTGALVIESPGLDQAGIGGNELQPGGIFTMNGGTLTVTGGYFGAGIGGGGDSHATEEDATHGGLHTRGWAGTITINGGTVAATGGTRGAGIGCGWRGDGGTVTIAGGMVTASGGTNGAGIGGGGSTGYFHQSVEEIHITGGNVTATGSDYSAGIGGGWWGRVGTIAITGGSITATGGATGAGIGSGYFGAGGTITIGGGTVTATGGDGGAGIGGGRCVFDCNITISDGTVIATGGRCGAGIGGGLNLGTMKYTGGSVTITGGHVTATGGTNDGSGGSAGIGGGGYGPGGDVTITGGIVEATYGDRGTGAGIGGGFKAGFGTITITGGSVRATANAGQCIGRGDQAETDGTLVLGNAAAGIFLRVGYDGIVSNFAWAGVADRESVCRNFSGTVVVERCEPHDYDRTGHCARCGADGGTALQYVSRVNAEGQSQGDADCLTLTESTAAWNSAGLNGGWYAVTENLAIPNRIEVVGNVNLILCDGATLTAPKGIEVAEGNSLTIWRQSDATGALLAGTTNGTDATCEAGDAAIGGASGENAGTVTVNGGNVTVVAGAGAQAIGHGAGATGAGNLHFLHTRVFDGVAATEPVGHAQREAVCRGGWARLADCLEHDYFHGTCSYCGFRPAIGYYDPAGRHLQTTTDYVDYLGQTVLGDGWYVLFDDVETISRVAVTGHVNLVLCAGATWNARAGVNVVPGGSLTIWAQSDGGTRGALVAVGGDGQAGIGGGAGEDGGAVTVYGGSITATGGAGGTGIGGGANGAGGEFTFRGGTVTAVAGTGAQAIGRGVGGEGEGGLTFSHVQIRDDVSAAAPVATAERENACRGAWVRLETCTEHALQDGFCRYCGMPAKNIYQDTTSANAPYRSCSDYTIYSGQLELTDGWYVVDSIRRVEGRINASGDVNLILCDGSELTATHGIHVAQGNSLTVWAQSQDAYAMGVLIATGAEDGEAGIGGNASQTENGPGGTVTINGGKVTAVGAGHAAGIGGGAGAGGTVIINGGAVVANGGEDAAGIGGGFGGGGGTVTISGGAVAANGGNRGQAIGGGYWTSDNGNLNITRGYRVGLMNGSGAVVEWASYYSRADICRNADSAVLVERCESHVEDDHDGFCDSCGALLEGSSDQIYLDPVNGPQPIRRDCQPYTGETVLGTGWYAVTRSWQIDARLEISGDVNLILYDGAKLAVTGGVHVARGIGPLFGGNNSLTTWAQSDDADTCGALTAIATEGNCAGIGGNKLESAGTITINGGRVDVGNCLGDKNVPIGAAGIGGGSGGDGGTIVIRGGVVTVTSCSGFTAIGGGGSNRDGSLDIPGMRVGTVNGSDVSWVNYAHRVSTCRSANTTVCIERCWPHDIGDSSIFCEKCGTFCLDYESGSVDYRDPTDGDRLVQADCSLYAGQSAMVSGWYAVTESRQFNGRLSIFGDVNLILCDNAELTVTGGVHVAAGNSLTIWTQSADNRSAGRLTVTGPAIGNAGIGADAGESGGAVTIHGGTVTVVGGENAQAIGRGSGNGDSGSLTLYGECRVGLLDHSGGVWEWAAYGSRTDTCRDTGGSAVRIERCESHADGDFDCRCDMCGEFCMDYESGSVDYRDPTDGNRLVQADCFLYAGQSVMTSGWYAVTESIQLNGRLSIFGDVNLILCDDAELTITGGVHVAAGNSLTIWTQSADNRSTGRLTVTEPATGNAGIGADAGESGGAVTIHGGTVTVVGGENAQAIGRGSGNGDSGSLALYGECRVGLLDHSGSVWEWAAYVSRTDACRDASGAEVRIERCESHVDGDFDCRCDHCGAFVREVFDVPYLDPVSGNQLIITNCPFYTGAQTLNSGWYAVTGSVTVEGLLEISGDVNLILCDGAELAALAGIHVIGENRFTVWAQSEAPMSCGRLTVPGANNFQAGIGGGEYQTAGIITIYGGMVMVYGGTYAAGIGSGDYGLGGTVTISGGAVTANGGLDAAGIGSGFRGTGGMITISGGAVTANGGLAAAGIGGGYNGAGGTITISGGTITAVGGKDAQALGAGYNSDNSGILVIDGTRVGTVDGGNAVTWVTRENRISICRNRSQAKVRLEPCVDHANITDNGDGTHSWNCLYCGSVGHELHSTFTNNHCVVCGAFGGSVAYLDPTDGIQLDNVCDEYERITGSTVAMMAGWYVAAPGQTVVEDRITVAGNVNLILCDGAALNAMSGITVAEGARLTIWGQEGEHAVPGTAVTTRGTGTLFAQTPASGDYRQASAIGGENSGTTGDIVINGGVVTARGVWGAGIGRGNIASGAVGSVTINGGYVDASGSSGSAGIGSGAYADSCPVTITGGYVLAAGCVYDATGQATPGIGTGRPRTNGSQPLSNGTITISGGTVVAQAGEAPSGGIAAQAIGVNAADAAHNGTGHLVLGDVRVYASVDATSPVAVSARGDTCRGTWVKVEACASHQDQNADTYCDYCGGYCGPVPPIDANGVFLIGSTDDWNVFAASVAAGKRYAGETVQLTANIAVTTTVGTGDHPFGGTFDGCGHTLTVAIDSSNVAAAPFGKIDGATIKNLTVAGTVTSSAYHAAGLVGGCGNDHPNTILNCTVAATVNGSGYAGGIVGHGGEGTLTMDGCVFSGAVSGFNACAGGLLGWCDALTLTITNCLCTGAFTPAGEGKYHPIACRYASRNVTATVADAYYLNTIVPTVLGVNPTVATSNLIPGAEGTPVSATLVAGVWTQPVTAADGNEYYGWTTAPAGRLVASYTFDDAGNNGANLLHASVGADAIVRATRTTPVAGIGEIAAVTDAAILSGLSAGDGAVSIPKDQHLAVPVPAALLSAHGRPYTIVMKIRVPNTEGWRSLLNMPASNDTDAMVYLQQNTRNIYLKQFNKASGAGIAASNGNVATDQWTTLAFAFGENVTDVYRDGTHVLHAEGALAGSYADCAAAGGYILVGADDNGDDDLFYLSDFRIYEGAVAVPEILAGTTSAYDDWAAANGAIGVWNAADASGVHNVFRYLFDKPSGAFENPPLISISFDASGRAVIHTPPLSPSATGFDISILATDDLAGADGTTYPLDADGETTIPASDKPARFFRLRVTER